MKVKPKGNQSVMASRREPPDSLEFFPTPPWATRAFCEHVLRSALGPSKLHKLSCWDPCAGEGHMAEVLREYFGSVYASDVFDYGKGYPVGSFVAGKLGLVDDLALCPSPPDWIVMNPPFSEAVAFTERALSIARDGVAVFVRLAWLETLDRYERLFGPRPPWRIAQFSERCALVKGRWDPEASTATSYVWVIWRTGHKERLPHFQWIPPGQKESLTRLADLARFVVTQPGMFDKGSQP